MPIEILMPALSPTMTEGNLASWQKQEGDSVSAGDVIAEIETDKATMEVEAVDEGVLGRILVPAGTENVAVNTPIAVLLEEGEDATALDGFKPRGNGGGAAQATATEPDAAAASAAPAPKPAPAPEPASAPAPAAEPASAPGPGRRLFASPLARRLARDAGLDLGRVTGSGPNGRIVKADVEAAVQAGVGPAEPAAAEPSSPPPGPAAPEAAPAKPAPPSVAAPSARQLADAWGIPYREIKPSGMRKTIARRLFESKTTVPHWYLTVDCELDRLLELRSQLNDRAGEGVKVSVNDMIIKAAAAACRRVPEANSAWTDEAILRFERVDVSVAVATEGGLITPIIKNADQKGLAAISEEMRDLATRARQNKLKPEEFQGGTFCISNLGMYGTREFAAIINPPQAAILALGKAEPRPVVKNGVLAIATMMSATLSADHRVVDGAVSATYMSTFKTIVEDPITLLL